MTQPPIIQICRGQPELAVRLVQPGCRGGQLVDYRNIRLVIQAPTCHGRQASHLCFKGCWPGHNTPWESRAPIQELPILVYPAFTLNGMGETVFRLDEQLWRYPSGRYIGNIELLDGTHLSTLDIDLCNVPVIIDSITLTEPSCNMELC